MGNAHVKIIASLRINNGLKCQRGTSSICFSAANPNNRGTGPATATPPYGIWHLYSIHICTYIVTLPSHYICLSVLKIKPKLNWSELNNALALKEPSSRFSNKFAECLSASESETNLWHVFQFLCPLRFRPPSPPSAEKPASSRVNLPKVSASRSLPLPLYKEAKTAASNYKRKMCYCLCPVAPPAHYPTCPLPGHAFRNFVAF